MITYLTPSSLSMSAEISPVKAPDFSKCMFSAPIAILEPLAFLQQPEYPVNGTQRTISHHLVLEKRLHLLDQSLCFCRSLVHLPVTGDNGLTISAIHVGFTPFKHSDGLFRLKSLCIYTERSTERARYKSVPNGLTCPAGMRCPAAPVLPGTPVTRRRRWRCGSSCRRSRASEQQLRSRRRR